MKIEGKFIFKVAGTLTAISLVVALLLGLTNMLTADKIAAINKQKTEEALAKVVSAADCEFPPMEEIPQAMIDAANEQGGKLSEVYEVQSGGDTIGYAFKVTASGSQGNIVMIVGVDTDWTESTEYGDVVLTSVMKGIGESVVQAVGDGVNGEFSKEAYVGTLENEGVGLAPLGEGAPADLQTKLDELKQEIIDGTTVVETENQP